MSGGTVNVLPALQAKIRAVQEQGLLEQEGVNALPSPCISVCRMDVHHLWCQGCLRTLDELQAWGGADRQTQRHIWLAVMARANMAC